MYNSNGAKLIRKGNNFINENRVFHADSTFFNVFSFKTIEGDIKTALNDPNTVVITESAANKYFGTTNALGKIIETNDDKSTLYKVTAVIMDMPTNSHFNADLIFSMDNVNYEWGSYLSHNFHTYLLLRKGTDVKAFEKKFIQYTNTYVLAQAKAIMNIQSMDDFKKAGNKLDYSLIPLTDIHLRSDRSFELSPSGNIQYVVIFSAVALFILVIACINFMNLTTARSAGRAKEVGIRKVLGTDRRYLIGQFLCESTLMAVFAFIVSLGIVYLIFPLFNTISGKQMSFSYLFSFPILLIIIIIPFIVGLLAGSYPAFYLSAFKPIQVLKGKLSIGARSGGLRSVLVVFQFATSIILIIGTIVIYRQLNYIQNKKLGFSKDQVLVIDNTYALANNTTAFKNELVKNSGVINASYSDYLPVSNSSRNDQTFSKEAVIDAKSGLNMQYWTVDDQYIPTMGMNVVKGRNFSSQHLTDSNAVIINETTAKILGYEDPIGKLIYTIDDISTGRMISFTIIGVVQNFNFESLKESIGPLCMRFGKSTGLASFKVKADKASNIINQAEGFWKTMAPGIPFHYRFLDESFDEMYRAEQRIGKIALIFSSLAIFIACLGLFGLAAYIAEQRTKEIGIRKVLGASVTSIVSLLSKDFIKLVSIAFLIAAPLAGWFMYNWLQDFAYRTPLSWWIFLVAAIIALLIAVLTISMQSIKAALVNPVKNLRTE
ncbi:ABC transporter permease [Flavisolibacter tropicus]|uniref:ABC transporter permease n=1 Tax=Flavisolibacter tropicus TaxID=1492898 RepID=UPI001D03B10E